MLKVRSETMIIVVTAVLISQCLAAADRFSSRVERPQGSLRPSAAKTSVVSKEEAQHPNLAFSCPLAAGADVRKRLGLAFYFFCASDAIYISK